MIAPTPISTEEQEIDRQHMHNMLRQMILLRRFEERTAELYQASKVRGFLHLYVGEEAIAVGVMQCLTPEDSIVATYREHGQALARGVSADALMAEMYGKVEGCCRGRGGSMHIFDAKTRFFGGNAIVGGGIPVAVGLALADKMQGRRNVSVCFFGDGAYAEGELHESMNLAALMQVPVLFICENNLYCMGTAIEVAHANTNLTERAATYHVKSAAVDGMDVLEVEKVTRETVDAIRNGGGPHFLEMKTYRFRPHSMFDAELYRTKAEVEEWKKRDPIVLFSQYLKERDLLTEADVAEMEKGVAAEVEHAVEFAEAGTWESVEELTRFVYTERRQP